MKIYRTEYPRPELVCENWTCLNGEWDFALCPNLTTPLERHPLTSNPRWGRSYRIENEFPLRINVPFCPESELSGVGRKDFIVACWYRKTLEIDARPGKRYLVNFEAVFHTANVFIGGVHVLEHKGGYTPFSVDVTDYIKDGKVEIKMHVYGDPRNHTQPSGKQSPKTDSYGCYYTRSTGIWQSVWLEEVNENHLSGVRLTPDLDNGCLIAELDTKGKADKIVTLTALFGGKRVGETEIALNGVNHGFATVALDEIKPWSIENPQLYDLEITVEANGAKDEVKSYFGLRKLELDEKGLKINDKRVFQRLVLDQGYHGKGVYIPETADELEKDILRSKAFGFNGARLHERVFERRFLYLADVLGYIVWGEYPNWGFNHTDPANFLCFLPEWLESVERDYNHPSVVGWCPFNENFNFFGVPQCGDLVRQVYLETKRADKTRPVIDVSWNYHVKTDIYDVHDYEGNVEKFREKFAAFEGNKVPDAMEQDYNGEPYFLSEFGGFKWPPEAAGWAYGETPKTETELAEKFATYIGILFGNPRICAFCYTQLTDVEQEVNGLYYYDRRDKFKPETVKIIREAMDKIAEYEKLD